MKVSIDISVTFLFPPFLQRDGKGAFADLALASDMIILAPHTSSQTIEFRQDNSKSIDLYRHHPMNLPLLIDATDVKAYLAFTKR